MEFVDTIIAMLQFLWAFLGENKDSILAVMSTLDLGAIIVGIVALIRNVIVARANTTATNTLRESNEELKGKGKNPGKVVLEKIDYTPLTNEQIEQLASSEVVIDCQNRITEILTMIETDDAVIVNKCDDIKNKLNSIIEAQTLVYSTIKDENMRRAVQGHLVAAKYSEPNIQEKIDNEMEEMQRKLSDVMEELNNIGVSAANAVKNVSMTEPVEEEVQIPRRY